MRATYAEDERGNATHTLEGVIETGSPKVNLLEFLGQFVPRPAAGMKRVLSNLTPVPGKFAIHFYCLDETE